MTTLWPISTCCIAKRPILNVVTQTLGAPIWPLQTTGSPRPWPPRRPKPRSRPVPAASFSNSPNSKSRTFMEHGLSLERPFAFLRNVAAFLKNCHSEERKRERVFISARAALLACPDDEQSSEEREESAPLLPEF